MSVTGEEFQRRRAERRRLRELEELKRGRNESAVRAVLAEHLPGGVPEGLTENICRIQNLLIKEVMQGEAVVREMHDGIHRIAEEAAQQWVGGFRQCADQVRAHSLELSLAPQVVDSLLRNDVRPDVESREERNEAASQRVEWKRV